MSTSLAATDESDPTYIRNRNNSLSIDVSADLESDGIDPTRLFSLGRVLSRHGPHGTIVRASVCDGAKDIIPGLSSVSVKLIAAGKQGGEALVDRVTSLVTSEHNRLLVRYHGAWLGPHDETWIVSDVCEGSSVVDVVRAAKIDTPAQRERVAACILRNALLAVDALHAVDRLHGDVRAQNFLVDGHGRIRIGDYGVYDILQAIFSRRTAYPGARLWPAPELISSPGHRYDRAAEVWAFGIVALEIVEGRAAVYRAMRGSRGEVCPSQFRNSAAWSSRFKQFIASACSYNRDSRPTLSQLLSSDLVATADASFWRLVFEKSSSLPTSLAQQTAFQTDDIVETMYRRNSCIRAPLLTLRDCAPEDFVGEEYCAQESDKLPAVETALQNALKSYSNRFTSRMPPTVLRKDNHAQFQTYVDTIWASRNGV